MVEQPEYVRVQGILPPGPGHTTFALSDVSVLVVDPNGRSTAVLRNGMQIHVARDEMQRIEAALAGRTLDVTRVIGEG